MDIIYAHTYFHIHAHTNIKLHKKQSLSRIPLNLKYHFSVSLLEGFKDPYITLEKVKN